MAIRLNKVTRDLNVSISTAVEFLQKKGFTVEENPNTKITEEQFDLLKQEFKSDKDLKLQSERLGKRMMQQEQKPKPVDKPAPAKPVVVETPKVEEKKVAEIKTEVPEDSKPRFKQVGHIDLDKLNQRTAPEKSAVKEKPAKTEKPEAVPEKKEEVPAEPVQEEKSVEVAPASKVETPKPEIPQPKVESVKEEEPVDEAPEVEDVFRLKGEEIVSKINVIGQIDLAALNQQTRPKKKSKEERKKERAEKEKGLSIAHIDLRFLNEKVAGEGGFIKVKGGKFVHGKTGKPVRFWAVMRRRAARVSRLAIPVSRMPYCR